MPIGCPVFFARVPLLGLGLLGLSLRLLGLLLLAHALELLVDLLRCLDSVRRLRLSCGGGRCFGRGSWIDWWSSTWGWPFRLRRESHGCGWVRIAWLGPVVKRGCIWVWRGGTTAARGEDELRRRGQISMNENHVAAGAVQ